MGILQKIFAPIAKIRDPGVALDDIDVVAFDTHGTLVVTNSKRTGYVAKPEIAQLLGDLQDRKDALPLEEVVIISGSPQDAEQALRQAGLASLLHKPVEDREFFYSRMEREGKKVLAIDDEFMMAIRADAVVPAKAEKVREYLQSDQYRQALER